MVSIEYSEALSEIDDIFNHLDIEVLSKIPKKFKEFVSNNKSNTYKPAFNHSLKLNELPLRKKTRAILSLIYFNFLCNEEQKMEYKKRIKENSIKREQEIKEKYNTDNLFKKKVLETKIQEEQQNIDNTVAMTEYKEGIFTKIINKIKRLIHIK